MAALGLGRALRPQWLPKTSRAKSCLRQDRAGGEQVVSHIPAEQCNSTVLHHEILDNQRPVAETSPLRLSSRHLLCSPDFTKSRSHHLDPMEPEDALKYSRLPGFRLRFWPRKKNTPL
jgi:hypothetical protein